MLPLIKVAGGGDLRFKFIVTAFCTALLAISQASAQSTFDPSRIPEQFNLPRQTEAAPVMPALPKPAPQAAGTAAVLQFVLNEVHITGLTALPDNTVAAAIQAYVGRNVTLVDLQSLATEITQLYRDAGYILAQVILPPQRIENGVVHLQALEGYISSVAFTGAEDFWLQASAEALKLEVPLKISTLQRWLLLANDAPGLTVTGQLTPDPDTPAGSHLTINVERKDIATLAGFDSRGSKFIGPWQAYSGMQWNGALLRGDMIALRGYTSKPEGQLKYVQVQQALPLGVSGLRLENTLDVVRSKPGDSLKALEAEGKTDSFKMALTYPVLRSLVQNIVVGLTAEINNSRTSLLDDPKNSPSVNDRTRVVSAVGSYGLTHTDGATSQVAVTLSRGLDVFNSSQGNQLSPSRTGATATFWRSVVELEHREPLPFIKQGSTLRLALQAQYSFQDSLLASEQLAAGGNSYGRGFDPASIAGDQGLLAKTEVAVPFTMPVEQMKIPTEAYGFFDAGWVQDVRPRTGVPQLRRLYSTGLGLRFLPSDGLSAYIEGAKQLPQSRLADSNDSDDFRLTVGFIAQF